VTKENAEKVFRVESLHCILIDSVGQRSCVKTAVEELGENAKKSNELPTESIEGSIRISTSNRLDISHSLSDISRKLSINFSQTSNKKFVFGVSLNAVYISTTRS
jgi:hypothetical protein